MASNRHEVLPNEWRVACIEKIRGLLIGRGLGAFADDVSQEISEKLLSEKPFRDALLASPNSLHPDLRYAALSKARAEHRRVTRSREIFDLEDRTRPDPTTISPYRDYAGKSDALKILMDHLTSEQIERLKHHCSEGVYTQKSMARVAKPSALEPGDISWRK